MFDNSHDSMSDSNHWCCVFVHYLSYTCEAGHMSDQWPAQERTDLKNITHMGVICGKVLRQKHQLIY